MKPHNLHTTRPREINLHFLFSRSLKVVCLCCVLQSTKTILICTIFLGHYANNKRDHTALYTNQTYVHHICLVCFACVGRYKPRFSLFMSIPKFYGATINSDAWNYSSCNYNKYGKHKYSVLIKFHFIPILHNILPTPRQ